MKESINSIQKIPIFRETFNDEATLRKNGGVPTAVTFANGIASCVAANSSKINYLNLNLKGVYSVRLRFTSVVPSSNSLINDFRGLSGVGTGFIIFDAGAISVASSSGTAYVNGIAATAVSASTTKEIVVAGITLSATELMVSSRYTSTSFITANWELLEIYEGTLNSNDVKNLYNNKRYKPTDTLTPIIDVDAFGGAIKNRANSTAITNTAVETVRDGNIYAMRFNGTTSKLDLGAYNSLVGDITICVWAKRYSRGEGNEASFLNNGKLVLRDTAGTNNFYVFQSDGNTSTSSSVQSLILQKYQQIIITRTSAGVTNFYVNAVISGNFNQSSGTPVAGSTNITIGNASSSDRTLDGNIAQVQVFSGIMSTNEIAQKFGAERRLYSV